MNDDLAGRPLLRLRGPYDFTRSIGFWRRSTGELCEQWQDGVYRRFVTLAGQPRLLTLGNAGTVEQPAVTLELDGQPASPAECAALDPLVRGLLGEQLDLAAFYAAVAHDPVMADVTQQLYGVRAPCAPLWETLCWVILGQQISVPFALLLKSRLVARYGTPSQVAGRTLYRFPAPELLAQADTAELLPMQLSRNKASFITGLASHVVAGTLDLAQVAAMPTPAAVEYLIGFRGIGRWTAEFTLMRGLARPDALPGNDAGVRQGIAALYGERLPEPALRAFATRWGAWGGAVGLYLLAWLRETRAAGGE